MPIQPIRQPFAASSVIVRTMSTERITAPVRPGWTTRIRAIASAVHIGRSRSPLRRLGSQVTRASYGV